MKKTNMAFVGMVAAGLLLMSPAVTADLITFSGALSDNDEPNLAVFSATYDYTFDDLLNVLTLEVTNSTSPAYTLSEVFMNVGSDVTGLTLTGNGGFSSATLLANQSADGFGTFDYQLDLVVPPSGNDGLASGSSAMFTFAVTGANLDISDFFSGGTDKSDAVASVKFTQGPRGDSVYALPGEGVVPEPATWLLMAAGLAGLAARRR